VGVALLGAILLPPILLLAQPKVKFDTRRLLSDKLVNYILAEDLSGDGLPDITVQSGKDLMFFWQRKNNTFPSRPDMKIRLPDNTFLWCLGKIGQKDRPSIVLMTSRGICAYKPSKDRVHERPEELIICSNILDGRCSSPPIYWDFMPDLNGDGLSDPFLLDKDGILLFVQDKQGNFTLNQKLEVAINSRVETTKFPHESSHQVIGVPVLAFGKVNDDDRPDILIYEDDQLRFFYQGEDGRFKSKEALVYQVEGKKKKRKRFFNFEIPPILKDIDGDGTIDLALIYPSRGRIQIYYTKGGRCDLRSPDDIKDTKEWAPAFWLKDFNQDGRQDLVIASVQRLGVIGAVQMFMAKKVNLHLSIFPSKEDGRMVKEPSQVLSFTVPYVVSATRESGKFSLTFNPNFDGDFNGDGLKDLLIAVKEEELIIYYGDKEKILNSTPGSTIRITPPQGTAHTDSWVYDLNKDGRSDIILRCTNLSTQRSSVILLLSKG
jgi:hypothetical protein